MRSTLFERVLREIEVTPDFLFNFLYLYFKEKLNDDRALLPDNFIKTIVVSIVKDLLKFDKLFTNDQGFILIPNEGTRLRRGAEHLQIRAFIDIVIQVCSDEANKMLDIPIGRLKPYQKTFIQAFSDESSNENWKPELAKLLTNAIAESKPFYIKVDPL